MMALAERWRRRWLAVAGGVSSRCYAGLAHNFAIIIVCHRQFVPLKYAWGGRGDGDGEGAAGNWGSWERRARCSMNRGVCMSRWRLQREQMMMKVTDCERWDGWTLQLFERASNADRALNHRNANTGDGRRCTIKFYSGSNYERQWWWDGFGVVHRWVIYECIISEIHACVL